MDDALDVRILLENGLRRVKVAQIDLFKRRTNARDFLDAVEHFNLRVRQIVNDNYFVACLLQFYGRVRTDEAGSASHKDGLFHIF